MFCIYNTVTCTSTSKKILKDTHRPLVLRLNIIRSEEQLTKEISSFYESDQFNVLVFQCQPNEDSSNLLLLKISIEQTEREMKNKLIKENCENSFDKKICVILHINRTEINMEDQWRLSFTSEWRMFTLDRLESSTIELKDIIGKSVPDIFETSFHPLMTIILDNLLWALSRFKESQSSFSDYVASIRKCGPLLESIHDKILELITDSYDQDLDDWQVQIARDTNALIHGKTLEGALKNHLSEIVKSFLLKLTWFLEKYSAWHSIISSDKDETIIRTWTEYFQRKVDKSVLDNFEVKRIELIEIGERRLDLRFPFSRILFESIKSDFWN